MNNGPLSFLLDVTTSSCNVCSFRDNKTGDGAVLKCSHPKVFNMHKDCKENSLKFKKYFKLDDEYKQTLEGPLFSKKGTPIVNYENLEFNQIPVVENPAFTMKYPECFLICKNNELFARNNFALYLIKEIYNDEGELIENVKRLGTIYRGNHKSVKDTEMYRLLEGIKA